MSLPPIEWIDASERLAAACAELRSAGVIGIDTEFVRTRTFHARLGLIQFYDGAGCRLIDPLAIDEWSALEALLTDPGVIKVIHSGSEDFEILNRVTRRPLAGFFDTQIAAALTGLGPSLSYQALVQTLIGVELPKGETRSNWLRRPLSEAQRTYAVHDVEHLIAIHAQLAGRLDELGRTAWAAEDFARATLPPPNEEKSVRQQFRRLKQGWRLGPVERAAAMALLGWREATARRIDRPRNRLLDDAAIHAIAVAQPETLDQLARCAPIDPHTLKRNGTRLLAIVREARDSDTVPPPIPPPLERGMRPLLKRLKSLVARRADELGLAPEVLCGRKQLVYLLQHHRLPRLLRGWRRAEIGDRLLATLEREREPEAVDTAAP